ncbi:hypothetical protein I3271_00860 [Photobacterium leiognathi]|uniref:hypothetical protein n=1 Tax=Photobacterium leiognathi TaxID=553611 RepID=UPI001EDE5BA7|nr:hypothetical protein [Photobacterium leiognathi]MCG3883232.1 hypothetical protein [Photobacterium leiognathi]
MAMKTLSRSEIKQARIDKCLKSSANYTLKSEWRKHDKDMFELARENGILDMCTKHMRDNWVNQDFYMTKEQCLATTSDHTCFYEWSEAEDLAFNRAVANNWHDECRAAIKANACAISDAKKTKKSLNSYESSDNIDIKNSDLNQLLRNPINEKLLFQYCCKSAHRYNCVDEWIKTEPKSHALAIYYGWFEIVTQHISPHRRYTLLDCRKASINFGSETEWKEGDPDTFLAAKANYWLGQCRLKQQRHNRLTTDTFEGLIAIAEQYKSGDVWQKEHTESFDIAKDNGWLDQYLNIINKNVWSAPLLQLQY